MRENPNPKILEAVQTSIAAAPVFQKAFVAAIPCIGKAEELQSGGVRLVTGKGGPNVSDVLSTLGGRARLIALAPVMEELVGLLFDRVTDLPAGDIRHTVVALHAALRMEVIEPKEAKS